MTYIDSETIIKNLTEIFNASDYDYSKYEDIKNVDDVTKELEIKLKAFKDIIPEFFSKYAQADNIKRIYQLISSGKENNIEITCINNTNAMYKYEEYYRGMIDFINEFIMSCNINKENDTYKKLVSEAQNKDKNFIDSLYGGELNPPATMELSEAVQCIETLIDFIPQIDHFKTLYLDTVNNIEKDERKSNEVIIGIYIILLKSVQYYCYKMIDSILHTYNTILNKIDNKESDNTKANNFRLF